MNAVSESVKQCSREQVQFVRETQKMNQVSDGVYDLKGVSFISNLHSSGAFCNL